MFVDNVKISVKSGAGGNGSVAFRHEKYVPLGGPAGGDGGKGGSIVFVVDEGLRTLMDFRFKHNFKAQPGQNGMNKQMYGRGAEDLIIQVPAGTSIYNDDNGRLIGDLTGKDQHLVVAKGGKGGRGNMHFATSRNRAPEVAENGEPGVELNLRLELKVIADIGLVGFPSVGKSTLLSVSTSARPKIAAYHFTTLAPNLGMVQLDNGQDFVMADLPGLIEGASNGVGLGIQFLRHVERTKVILHLVEMDPNSGRDPVDDYHKIRQELATYDEKILNKPEIIVPTKMDMPGAEEQLATFKEAMNLTDADLYPISSIQQNGVDALLKHAGQVLDEYVPPVEDVVDDVKEYNFEPEEKGFEVTKEDDVFILTGPKVERLFAMSNLDHQDGIMRFARQLKSMGIEDALRDAGIESGDTVMIDDFTFEFV